MGGGERPGVWGRAGPDLEAREDVRGVWPRLRTCKWGERPLWLWANGTQHADHLSVSCSQLKGWSTTNYRSSLPSA